MRSPEDSTARKTISLSVITIVLGGTGLFVGTKFATAWLEANSTEGQIEDYYNGPDPRTQVVPKAEIHAKADVVPVVESVNPTKRVKKDIVLYNIGSCSLKIFPDGGRFRMYDDATGTHIRDTELISALDLNVEGPVTQPNIPGKDVPEGYTDIASYKSLHMAAENCTVPGSAITP